MANIDRHSLIPVLILSLVFSVVPLTGITLNLRSGSVNGWLDDLFGGSKSEDTTSGSRYAIFAEFEAIEGESMEADRKNWIDLDSFEFSMGVPGTISGTSRRSWDVVVNEIIITKRVDKSTPKLMEH
jgi:hypothetical protein